VENTSHDLATPLSVLQGHLSELDDNLPIEAVAKDILRRAMNESDYLVALLVSLALNAKFEAGARVQTVLDLRETVERSLTRHQPLAKRSGVSLAWVLPSDRLTVVGDPTFSEQAISNLIGNAIRYNRPGGHVAVVLANEGERFRLRVEDDGPGISHSERTRVVQRGQRGDAARTREAPGQGLGLSIVSRVATVQAWGFSLSPGEPHGLIAELDGPMVGAEPDRKSTLP
jgi:signal transduction histidine kinase